MIAAFAGAFIPAASAVAQTPYSIHFGAGRPDATAFASLPPDGDGGLSTIEGAAGIYGNTGWINVLQGFTAATQAGHPSGIVLNATTQSGGTGGGPTSIVNGDDGDLMSSCAESGNIATYTFTNLNPAVAYNVVIYHAGLPYNPDFQSPQDGGLYTLTSPGLPAPIAVQYFDTMYFQGTFVPGEDYHVIPVSGIDEFTLTATAPQGVGPNHTTPVNGIEISPVPEPANLVLLAGAACALMPSRRRSMK